MRAVFIGVVFLLAVAVVFVFWWDFEAPSLRGAKDLVAYNNVPPDYLAGVTAEDRRDDDVRITVDDSAVQWDVAGTYPVTYTAADKFFNRTQVTVNLTLVLDNEPPVISGAKDITVLRGAAIVYKDGVTVSDNLDPDPQLAIDTAGVDNKTPGIYAAVYTATDAAGNVGTVTVTVTVLSGDSDGYSPYELSLLVDDVMGKITSEGMTQTQKARAIYDWVIANIRYVGHADKDDWQKGAYLGLKLRYGDCFTSYAVSRALLDAAGIDNLPLERVGGIADHFWNLVNVGTGWYHFDTTEAYVGFPKHFMMTDAYTKEYEKRISAGAGVPNFYTYDTTDTPEMATEEFEE